MPQSPIKQRYLRLNEFDKTAVRELFAAVFKCSTQVFYRVINKSDISAKHLDFFSKEFGVPPGELLMDFICANASLVEASYEDHLAQQVADQVGLSKSA